jgi:hypothetical protein
MLHAHPLAGPAPRRAPTAAHPRPPRIVALCGQKGGAGKSTIAVCLAAEALARGRRVLLVDADLQGTARMWGDAALGAGKPAPTVVAMGATTVNPGQLDAPVAPFEVVLIDCPGRHDATQRAALMLCDLALLPCGPSSVDAWALASSLELVTRPPARSARSTTNSSAHGRRPPVATKQVPARTVPTRVLTPAQRRFVEGPSDARGAEGPSGQPPEGLTGPAHEGPAAPRVAAGSRSPEGAGLARQDGARPGRRGAAGPSPRTVVERADGRRLRRLQLYLAADVAKRLQHHCVEHDVDMSAFVNRVVQAALAKRHG